MCCELCAEDLVDVYCSEKVINLLGWHKNVVIEGDRNYQLSLLEDIFNISWLKKPSDLDFDKFLDSAEGIFTLTLKEDERGEYEGYGYPEEIILIRSEKTIKKLNLEDQLYLLVRDNKINGVGESWTVFQEDTVGVKPVNFGIGHYRM